MTDHDKNNYFRGETENSTTRRTGNPEKCHARETTHAPTDSFLWPRTRSNLSADRENSSNQPERHNSTGKGIWKATGYYTKAQYWCDAVVIHKVTMEMGRGEKFHHLRPITKSSDFASAKAVCHLLGMAKLEELTQQVTQFLNEWGNATEMSAAWETFLQRFRKGPTTKLVPGESLTPETE